MEDDAKVRKIGIAQGAVVSAPARLRTNGLGSCVGVVLFDVSSKVAGLVHVMLPTAPDKPGVIFEKYADTGVSYLVKQLCQHGASLRNLKAKIAGGAQMFQASIASDLLRIGPRNVEAVKKELDRIGVPILAEDTGGSIGRTIEFDTTTQVLHVKTALYGAQEI